MYAFNIISPTPRIKLYLGVGSSYKTINGETSNALLFENYTDFGLYQVHYAHRIIDGPSSQSRFKDGCLFVCGYETSIIIQLLIIGSPSEYSMAMRTYAGNVWNNWKWIVGPFM